MKLEIKGRTYDVVVTETGRDTYTVSVDGTGYDIRVPGAAGTMRDRTGLPILVHPATSENAVLAPLPGLVVKILVHPGEEVKQGQHLVMLESMKMHLPVTSPSDGKVTRILVHVGESLSLSQKILELE